MRETADEFAAYLRKLRRDRGIGSTKLSEKIGKHRTYLGIWERDASRKVNTAVLEQVADALSLTAAERHRIFQLADERNRPDPPTSFSRHEQIQLNMHQALSEVAHESSASGPVVEEVCENVGWLLALFAAREALFHITGLAWPESLARNKVIIPDQRVTDLPPDLRDEIAKALPIPSADTIHGAQVFHLGRVMAKVYRAWLLADLDRCRQLCSSIKRWSWTTSESRIIVTVVFRDVDANGVYGVDRITCGVLGVVAWRQLAEHIWQAANKQTGKLKFYRHSLAVLDNAALQHIRIAETVLQRRNAAEAREWQQDFRDALYVIQSPTWQLPDFASLVYKTNALGRGLVDDTAALLAGDIEGAVHAKLAPDFVERSIETLKAALALVPQEPKSKTSTRKRAKDGSKDSTD